MSYRVLTSSPADAGHGTQPDGEGGYNIVTRDPEKSGPQLRLSSDYGSFQSARGTVDFSFPRSERFSWDLGGQFYRTDGFDLDKSTPHTNGQEAIDRLNLESKWSYRLSPKWRAKTSLASSQRSTSAWSGGSPGGGSGGGTTVPCAHPDITAHAIHARASPPLAVDMRPWRDEPGDPWEENQRAMHSGRSASTRAT